MSNEQEMMLHIYRWFSVLLTPKGLQQIIGRAEKLFGYPVLLIESEEYRITACGPKALSDHRLLEEINTGAFSSDHISLITESLLKCASENKSLLIHDPCWNGNAVYVPVAVRSNSFAWLAMSSGDALITDEIIHCFEELAHIIGLEMRKNKSFHSAAQNPHFPYLQELLENPHPNPVIFERWKKQLHLDLSNYFHIIALQEANEFSDHINSGHLELSLRGILHHCIYTTYLRYFVILLPASDNDEIDSYIVETLRDTALKNHLAVGISNCFSDLSRIHLAWHQAVNAIHLGLSIPINNQWKPLYYYYDYSILEIWDKCLQDGTLLEHVSPKLMHLLDYDTKNNTELMDTLYLYLENSENILKTASALYIHKNTLLHRMSRIKEILNSDLSNSWERFRISMSFRILMFMNIYRPNIVKKAFEHLEKEQNI